MRQSNLGYRPIDSTHPGATPGTYIVREGDTLQSIAQQVYGDRQLWYLIADANGSSASSNSNSARPGQTLLLPNPVGTLHNDSKTFKPYEASRVLGDTTPNLPAPAGDEGCGGFGAILVMIVIVVVAVISQQYYLMEYGSATTAAGATVTGSVAAEGVAAGTATWTTGSMVASGAVGGAVGSIAGQIVGNAIGVQDGFSWKQVALSAVGGAVTGGMSGWSPMNGPGSSIGNAAARVAVGNAITQGIGVATGLQDHFSWTSVAASAVGAGVGAAAASGLQGSAFAKQFGAFGVKGASSFVGGMTTAALHGGRISVQQVAVDAFGNALGNSIAEANRSGTARQSVSYSAEGQAQDFARESNRSGWTQTPESTTDLGSGLDPNLTGSPELRYRGLTAADLRAQADEWTLARIKANAFSDASTQSSASGPTMRDFDPTGTWQPNAMPLDVPQADASKWFKEAKAWVNEKAESAWDSVQKRNPDDFAILSPKNASAAAQYWANRHIETGSALYAIPGGLAAAWAEYPDEVGMILSMGRSGKMAPEEIGPSGMPMLVLLCHKKSILVYAGNFHDDGR